VLSTAGATILGAGYLLPLCYLLWSLKKGRPAGNNPWDAAGLEWQTASPPPKHNFLQVPVVDWEAYDYASRPPRRPQGDVESTAPDPSGSRDTETEGR